MLLHIVARGRIGRGAEADLVDRYAARISWPFRITELPDRGGKVPPAAPRQKTIWLDERGKALDSAAFAEMLGRWRDDAVREARFMIGAADGHGAAVHGEADLLLGFGAATWPHLLVRVLLAEQLYRATAILAGHPYHREG